MKNLKSILATIAIIAIVSLSFVIKPQQTTFEYLEVELVYGLNRGVTFFTFSEEHEEFLKGQKFKSSSAALTFLGSSGWELVSVNPTEHGRSVAENAYIFKRTKTQ
ncbi:hypothetical protein [Roseivirga seohaensis]|uniref:hypothetical protein n=1 Tax=Roseivirga seohaensis TaxID=1914963 RepID=UPI003BA929AD